MQDEESIYRAEKLDKAQRYSSLAATPAFIEIMDYLRAEATASEGIALTTPFDMPTEEVRRAIIKWQERKSIVLAIEQMFDQQLEIKRAIEEDIENDRIIAASRNARGKW